MNWEALGQLWTLDTFSLLQTSFRRRALSSMLRRSTVARAVQHRRHTGHLGNTAGHLVAFPFLSRAWTPHISPVYGIDPVDLSLRHSHTTMCVDERTMD